MHLGFLGKSAEMFLPSSSVRGDHAPSWSAGDFDGDEMPLLPQYRADGRGVADGRTEGRRDGRGRRRHRKRALFLLSRSRSLALSRGHK